MPEQAPYEVWLDEEDYYPENEGKTNVQLHHNIPMINVREVDIKMFDCVEPSSMWGLPTLNYWSIEAETRRIDSLEK